MTSKKGDKNMKYVIPVYVRTDIESLEDLKLFETAMGAFIGHRLGIPNTFEVHGNKFAMQHEVYGDEKVLRICTTDIKFCYPGASITNYDFNSEIGTYFLEIEADENFKSGGTFCPRLLVAKDSMDKVGQVVGLDYIVKGMEINDCKS